MQTEIFNFSVTLTTPLIYNIYGGTTDILTSVNIASNFHHIALTCDSETQTARLYVDGTSVGDAVAWTKTDTITALTFCGAYNVGNRNGTAIIDEIQFYNAPLSADQVSYLYSNPSLYAATTYERTVSADGNWTDSAWTVGTQTDQPWANSAAVELSATDTPTLTVDAAITANSIDFVSGSMTVAGTNAITLNGEKRIGVTTAEDTATISAPLATGFTKTGAGTLSITNTGNTLTGGIDITAGTITANSVAAF